MSAQEDENECLCNPPGVAAGRLNSPFAFRPMTCTPRAIRPGGPHYFIGLKHNDK